MATSFFIVCMVNTQFVSNPWWTFIYSILLLALRLYAISTGSDAFFAYIFCWYANDQKCALYSMFVLSLHVCYCHCFIDSELFFHRMLWIYHDVKFYGRHLWFHCMTLEHGFWDFLCNHNNYGTYEAGNSQEIQPKLECSNMHFELNIRKNVIFSSLTGRWIMQTNEHKQQLFQSIYCCKNIC